MFMRTALIAALALGSFTACKAKATDPDKSADNTDRNKRDQTTVPTADKAVDKPSDLDLTQKIRKGVMADGSLGTNAHNCKIVVQDGKVTLVGPVASADESAKVAKIAADIAGEPNVINQLEVAK